MLIVFLIDQTVLCDKSRLFFSESKVSAAGGGCGQRETNEVVVFLLHHFFRIPLVITDPLYVKMELTFFFYPRLSGAGLNFIRATRSKVNSSTW